MKHLGWLAGGLTAVCLTVTGCGPSGGKLPLAGEVLVAGKPVSEGSISFTSGAGDETAYASISNGKFSITADKGLPAGSYRVVILGFEPTGRQIEDSDFPGQMISEKQAIVPTRYNENSQLQVDIGPEDSESLSFELEAN